MTYFSTRSDRSDKVSSYDIKFLIITTKSAIGTEVKKDVASKMTNKPLGSDIKPNVTKCEDFSLRDEVFLVYALIGLNGRFSKWIYESSYKREGFESLGILQSFTKETISYRVSEVGSQFIGKLE